MLLMYNTLTGRKEPVKKEKINMYFCGPTVYDFAHIGNFRAYVFSDILRRYLWYIGKKTKFVMNITDVDDKTIKKSQKEKISMKEFTRKYEKEFFKDLKSLRIKKADNYPRATENITGMVSLIKKLLEKKIAYRGEDGSIYYDISKFPGYGKLSKLDTKSLKKGARVRSDEYEKENAHDFALWKKYSKEDGDVFWEADFGEYAIKGRPGWHIECSVMAMKNLKQIDMHGGGVDLIFPHHENEIAQSEPLTGKFADHWVHNEHLLVNGKKMSKSLGNFYTLRDLLEKKFSPVAIRYLLLASHYKSQLNFTLDSIKKAEETVNNINDFVNALKFMIRKTKIMKENHEISDSVKMAKKNFEEKMNNDLNTPEAMAGVFELINITNREMDKMKADGKSLKKVLDFLMSIDSVLGILEDEKKLTPGEESLVKKREDLRKEKKYKEADKIREVLMKKGILLEDTPYGVHWKKIEV